MGKQKDLLGDQDTFKECTQPFETRDAAEAAYTAFWKDVWEARLKHKIDSFVLIVQASHSQDGGGHLLLTGHAGDSRDHPLMVARVYGAYRRQMFNDLDNAAEGKAT